MNAQNNAKLNKLGEFFIDNMLKDVTNIEFDYDIIPDIEDDNNVLKFIDVTIHYKLYNFKFDNNESFMNKVTFFYEDEQEAEHIQYVVNELWNNFKDYKEFLETVTLDDLLI